MTYDIDQRFATRRLDKVLSDYGCSRVDRLPGRYLDVALLYQTPSWLAAMATRLSHESTGRQSTDADRDLLNRMIAMGPEHEKGLRGVLFYLAIEAPRYWWAEMDTYTVGTIGMGSTSTMHKEAKKLHGDDLVRAKSILNEGTLQLRIRAFSHPTLRRICAQREKHRLSEWHELINFVEPFLKL